MNKRLASLDALRGFDMLFITGLASLITAICALFHYVIDVRGWGVHKDSGRDWTLFFRVVGMNSITIYLLPRIIDFRYAVNFLFGGIIGLLPEGVGKHFFYRAVRTSLPSLLR